MTRVPTNPLWKLDSCVSRDGWAITPPVMEPGPLHALRDALAPVLSAAAGHGGVRNLLWTSDIVREIAAEGPVRDAATCVLGDDCGAVRAILFDKTPDTNWRVVWHQDLTIAVEEERPTPGYGPWSRKEGVVHVQPPVEILQDMLAVRLHLDSCTTTNGPVRVLTGSHTHGRLDAAAIDAWRSGVSETECLVEEGGLLIFRPLLLHASSPAKYPVHRRVLHIEYGPTALSGGLRWHTWVPARAA